MSYHNRIMNIQSLPRMDDPPESGVAYKFGHRDARHAAAEIANGADAEIARLKERIAELEPKAARYDWLRDTNHPRIAAMASEHAAMLASLREAEAALADIGDADREPGDDVAWCEARAAKALPAVRDALAKAGVK